MGETTFNAHDLLMVLSTLGPMLIGGVTIYVKLQRWQAAACATDKSHADSLTQLSQQIQSLREELHGIDKDHRYKIGRLHDRVNANEAGLAEVKGWREGKKEKG